MRTGAIILIAGLGVVLSGCDSDRVQLGAKGAMSPAESGQHGAGADQAAPYGPEARAKKEHEIKPITVQYTNGNTDATMEGSGNLASQGNLARAEQQRQGLTPQGSDSGQKAPAATPSNQAVPRKQPPAQ